MQYVIAFGLCLHHILLPLSMYASNLDQIFPILCITISGMGGEPFFFTGRGGAGKESKFVERGGPGRGTPPSPQDGAGRGTPPPRGEGSHRAGRPSLIGTL